MNDQHEMGQLIAEYERLRKLAHDLDVVLQAEAERGDEQFARDLPKLKTQADRLRARLIKIEAQLPEDYVFPGYPMLQKRNGTV